MTKGLRCGNCDSTIHRKVVLDFILNQKAPYLRCKNTFCNVRWKRSVLEQHKAQFLGEDETKTEAKTPEVKKEVKRERIEVRRPAKAPKKKKKRTEPWLDRIRKIARGHVKVHGVVSVDDLRVWADIHNDQPSHPSVWGSVFQGDEWKKVSEKRSKYSSARSRKITVWALRQPQAVVV